MNFKIILATAVLLFVSSVLGTPVPQAESLCEWTYSSGPMGTQELFMNPSTLIGTSDYVTIFLIDNFSSIHPLSQQCTVIGQRRG